MDALIAAAARALAAGDAIGALSRVALREDPPARALRGIAMAQLGEWPRARALLRAAARGFGAHEERAQARCVVAEAEVALAMRDLAGSPRALAAAAAALGRLGDRANAAQAQLVLARRALLLGRLAEAADALAAVEPGPAPPALVAVAELAAAELALRALDTARAGTALVCAAEAAERAGIPALRAEAAEARAAFEKPAARLAGAPGRSLRLAEIAALRASGTLVVDACRRALHAGRWRLGLARRPVLFTLARTLAEGWPGEVDRDVLIAAAFRLRDPDETHRARLRVELGRLRRLAAPVAAIDATPRGYALRIARGGSVAVLLPPVDGDAGALVALLADGAAWSSSALALALGESQRNVQRALAELQQAGRVRAIGQARAQRWLAPPLAGFTTILLLPQSLADP